MKKRNIHIIGALCVPQIIFTYWRFLAPGRLTSDGQYIFIKYGIESTYDDYLGWAPAGIIIFVIYMIIYDAIQKRNKTRRR